LSGLSSPRWPPSRPRRFPSVIATAGAGRSPGRAALSIDINALRGALGIVPFATSSRPLNAGCRPHSARRGKRVGHGRASPTTLTAPSRVTGLMYSHASWAVGRDLEEMPLGIRADKGVAVGETLAAGADVAEEAVAVGGPIGPDHLPGDLPWLVVRVLVVRLAPVTGVGRVHIFACVMPVGIEEGIDFEQPRTAACAGKDTGRLLTP